MQGQSWDRNDAARRSPRDWGPGFYVALWFQPGVIPRDSSAGRRTDRTLLASKPVVLIPPVVQHPDGLPAGFSGLHQRRRGLDPRASVEPRNRCCDSCTLGLNVGVPGSVHNEARPLDLDPTYCRGGATQTRRSWILRRSSGASCAGLLAPLGGSWIRGCAFPVSATPLRSGCHSRDTGSWTSAGWRGSKRIVAGASWE